MNIIIKVISTHICSYNKYHLKFSKLFLWVSRLRKCFEFLKFTITFMMHLERASSKSLEASFLKYSRV
jgi:hypothetical protein